MSDPRVNQDGSTSSVEKERRSDREQAERDTVLDETSISCRHTVHCAVMCYVRVVRVKE